jgi:hypothetical protein
MTRLRAVPTLLLGFCLGAVAVIAASPLIAVIVFALLAGAYRLAVVMTPERGAGVGTTADPDASRGRFVRARDSRRRIFNGEEDVCGSESQVAGGLIGRSSAAGRWLVARPWLVVRAARRTRR